MRNHLEATRSDEKARRDQRRGRARAARPGGLFPRNRPAAETTSSRGHTQLRSHARTNERNDFPVGLTPPTSDINPYFRAPSTLKPLNSSSRYQNLPGETLTAHSDHRGPLSETGLPPKPVFVRPFFALFDFCSPYVTFS